MGCILGRIHRFWHHSRLHVFRGHGSNRHRPSHLRYVHCSLGTQGRTLHHLNHPGCLTDRMVRCAGGSLRILILPDGRQARARRFAANLLYRAGRADARHRHPRFRRRQVGQLHRGSFAVHHLRLWPVCLPVQYGHGHVDLLRAQGKHGTGSRYQYCRGLLRRRRRHCGRLHPLRA